MAKIKAQGQKKHVQQALNIKSVAPVGTDNLQVCWCEGFGAGCRQIRCQAHVNVMLPNRES